MADREKVIRGLECIGGYMHMEANPCAECGYNECQTFAICVGEVARDALELLKEQKGVPYVYDADGETACGVCGCHFDKAYSNCPKCGKKVDWNA